jgi:hypothetical protein
MMNVSSPFIVNFYMRVTKALIFGQQMLAMQVRPQGRRHLYLKVQYRGR